MYPNKKKCRSDTRPHEQSRNLTRTQFFRKKNCAKTAGYLGQLCCFTSAILGVGKRSASEIQANAIIRQCELRLLLENLRRAGRKQEFLRDTRAQCIHCPLSSSETDAAIKVAAVGVTIVVRCMCSGCRSELSAERQF